MKELTKAEEQIMHVIWQYDRISVKDILDELPDPKPAVNTVSTVVRLLEKKGFVDHQPLGRGYLYFAIVDKENYTKSFMKKVVDKYFGNSLKEMVSFFARENEMNINEFEEMMNEVRDEINDK